MASDQNKSGVLKDKEEFGKHGNKPNPDENASAREDVKHMAEKTKAPPAGSPDGDRK